MKLTDKILIKLHIKRPLPPKEPDWSRLEPPVEKALQDGGLDTSALILTVKGDMDNEERYTDSYLSFDEKGLYLALFDEPVLPVKKKHTRSLEFEPKLKKLIAIPMEEIGELHLEQNLATGFITYDLNGEYFPVVWFSIGALSRFDRFCKVFNAYKSGENYKNYLHSPDENVCKKCGAPTAPGEVFCEKCRSESSSVIRRLFSFFGEVKGKMIFMVCAVLISTGIQLIIPKFSTQKLYDEVLNPGNTLGYDALFKALITLVLSIAGLKILDQLFTLFYQYVIAGILPWVVYGIKLKIFSAMQRLSVGFFTRKQTGSLMERVTRDSNNIYWFFVDGFPYVIASSITIVGIFIILLRTSRKLSFALLAAALAIGLLYPFFNRLFRKLHHAVWLQNSRLTSKVSDNINGHRIIKAFAKEEEELDEFGVISQKLMHAEIKASDTENTVFPFLSLVVYALGALVIGYGGVLTVKYHELTVGQLLSFVVYLQMLQSPLEFLSWVTNWWARCLDSAQRVFEIMDSEPDVKEAENPKTLPEFKGGVELRSVLFEYEPAHPVILNLSLRVEAGEMLGIVGKTGAGKTTISNLIARLYDPKEGSILIDGVDVKELSSAQMRKNIGIVSQDIFLFMGTIADNIRYARPEATDSEVIAAAKAAAAHDFIRKLPDGYETRVGSGGQDLSGGEKQRISIARTILQDPKILILDEATAAMDTMTEMKIQESLDALREGRTTIAIAHRLSTLRSADKLAVVEKGKCVEYGTFEELMAQKGAYYNMFRLQEEALKFIGIDEAPEAKDEEPAREEEPDHEQQ